MKGRSGRESDSEHDDDGGVEETEGVNWRATSKGEMTGRGNRNGEGKERHGSKDYSKF